MVSRGEAERQIWLMEFGWTTDTVNPAYSWAEISEETKAELVVRAFKYAAQHWSPWIGVMTLWNLPDPGWTAEREEYWWSIVEPDGTPRPTYERLLQVTQTGELPNLQPSLSVLPGEANPSLAADPPLADPVMDPSAVLPELISAGTLLRVIGAGAEGVPLREGPSQDATAIAAIAEGTTVESTGGSEWREGLLWRNIRDASGQEGWIAADLLGPA
jgi:hypothetical protein